MNKKDYSEYGINISELDETKEEDRKVLEMIKYFENKNLYYEKRRKKVLLFSYMILAFILSIVVNAILAIFVPSLQKFTQSYFIFTNFFSAGLCVYTFVVIIKTEMYKQNFGKWFIVFAIFGFIFNLINAFIQIYTYFFN